MNAVRQSVRPKHQVLILKCYPELGRNNQEAKPNSSELSYLLYYASTRRSKLQKVGQFLEKRTASDVWRGRTGNVQVTLQILKALIEKCPRDLPLFATFVLRVLRHILRSGDVQSCEDTVETFRAFSQHQDPATLSANQDYSRQYEEVVSIYAVFASKDTPVQTKGPTSVPIAVRYRKTGLEALKAVVSSESLSADTSKQLGLIMPVVLENLYSKKGSYLELLQEKEHEKEKAEREQAFKRRQSSSTMRTAETDEADPIAASGTTADADKLAEEEVGCLALSVLRVIFNVVNRGQLRIATSAVLRFLTRKIEPQSPAKNGFRGLLESDWSVALFDAMCRSAPVQDRFVILVSTVETLIRSPIVESDLHRQLLLATIIGWLLSSDINFIGLSVMDVLIGFVQHILLILQLGGKDSALEPHGQQADVIGNESFPSTSQQRVAAVNPQRTPVMEVVRDPSQTRVELLEQLRQCIADLATHIYYSDQTTDMVSAILSRLKPSPRSSIANSAVAIENPIGTVEAIADSASINEKPNTDGFFSFDTARITAMLAVKDILLVANKRDSEGSLIVGSRNKVSFSVWEGTQWLLRDPNHLARRAYVDALLTWLKFEPTKNDLLVKDKQLSSGKASKNGDNLAKRAVSNASREKALKSSKSTFLPLLHLAVYENAQQYCDTESEILLLHLLLANLIQKLGVNAAKSGLPMIWRLQEDIPNVDNPIYKIHIGSLVHGYLWALVEYFDIDASRVGNEIESEISRRRTTGLWAKSIQIPPLPLDRTLSDPATPVMETLSSNLVSSASLKPFDRREALVDRIGEAYGISVSSPPSSPPGSPGRSSVSMAGLSSSYINTQISFREPASLPAKVKEQLLSDWTRESCISSTTSDTRSASSMTGSKTGKSVASALQQFLMTNGDTTDNMPPVLQNDARLYSSQPPHCRPSHSKSPNRGSPTVNTSSTSRSTPRVDDLKRFLASPIMLGGIGSTFPIVLRSGRNRRDAEPDDTASDSMVSAGEISASEYSYGGTPTPSQKAVMQKDGIDGTPGRGRGDVSQSHEALLLSQKRAIEYQDTIGDAPEPSPSPNVATFAASLSSRPQTADTEKTGSIDADASPTPRETFVAPTSPPRPSSALGHHHVTADEAPVPEPEPSDFDVPPVPPLPRGLSTQNYNIPGAFPSTPGLEGPSNLFGDAATKQVEALETFFPPPKDGDHTIPAPRPTLKSPPPDPQESIVAKANNAALAAVAADTKRPQNQNLGPTQLHGHTRSTSADEANSQEASEERSALALLRGAQQQLAQADDKTAARSSGRAGSPVRDQSGYFFQETGLGMERPVTPTSLRSAAHVNTVAKEEGRRTPTKRTNSPVKARDGASKSRDVRTGGGLRPTTPTKSALKKTDADRGGTPTQNPPPSSHTRTRSLSGGARKKATVTTGDGKKRETGSLGRKSMRGSVKESMRGRERERARIDIKELLEGIDGGDKKVVFEDAGLAEGLGNSLGRERPVSRPPY